MQRFTPSFILASVILFSSSATHAVEINQLQYCSVTVAQPDGNKFSLLVPKINLTKIVPLLKITHIDCSDSALSKPLF
ncbi:MAG: hypothetical protein HC939_24655 [Pleurocapsa sp. SU_5_0]|nr:hypothetical protein [Pleurocapsa sp. SU_5_0]